MDWRIFNAVSGLMNTVQQPASEVATSVLIKREYYQKVGELRYLSNSFQFFTIPVGCFLGGLFVDKVFEPIMAMQPRGGLLVLLFGFGKGSGAAFLFAVLWIMGMGICLWFRRDKHIRKLEE